MKTHAPQCNVEKWFRNPEYLGVRECNCDGYHTFDELYDHRIELFIALCKAMAAISTLDLELTDTGKKVTCSVWRSERHHDGSRFEGWFIMGIFKDKGKQITYHLPMAKWDECYFVETLNTAPEWDGHTPAEVLERLKLL